MTSRRVFLKFFYINVVAYVTFQSKLCWSLASRLKIGTLGNCSLRNEFLPNMRRPNLLSRLCVWI